MPNGDTLRRDGSFEIIEWLCSSALAILSTMHAPIARSEEEVFAPRNVLGWTLFSVAAGSVNAAAFMACRSFVTHISGTVTNLGMDATSPALAAEYGLVLGAFVGGAMLSVLTVESLPATRKKLVALPFLVVFAVLVGVAIAGQAGAFGPFGATNTETRGAFALLALLAGSMGVQNAAVALTTGNTVRTTHLTGPATDFAANLVRAALGRGLGTRRETKWAMLRLLKMFAFAAGAAVAAKYASRLDYHVFSMSAGFVIAAVGFTFAPEAEAVEERAGHEEAGHLVVEESGRYPVDSSTDQPGSASAQSGARSAPPKKVSTSSDQARRFSSVAHLNDD